MFENIRAHYDLSGSNHAKWHNGLHDSIERELKEISEGVNESVPLLILRGNIRSVRTDISQLKVSADILGANGEAHQTEILNKLNSLLPESEHLSSL